MYTETGLSNSKVPGAKERREGYKEFYGSADPCSLAQMLPLLWMEYTPQAQWDGRISHFHSIWPVSPLSTSS